MEARYAVQFGSYDKVWTQAPYDDRDLYMKLMYVHVYHVVYMYIVHLYSPLTTLYLYTASTGGKNEMVSV